ncbi:signal peptidase I [Microbacterium sp. CFH 90308]|uniref:Signal peptidase I n=1 Tax=Microbacterium salsuginis TaxID=2722803 RepID=A0ABX1KBH2_9MICO|nr:signal peptidase I [Microbacterium sp. CFH 90308]NLP84304.1 signal peptidase I [Microbacterium sp. CFH 90308]
MTTAGLRPRARHAAAAPADGSRPSTGERAKDIGLWVVGVIGFVAVIWFVASQLLGLSVIVFRTGSMAPALPQGAAAVSAPVSADELQIGDVITVQRSGDALPVTHRIIAIDPVAGEADQRSVVLQGDDNETPDQQPYVVSETDRVLFGMPGAGAALVALQTPVALGAMTLVLAGVIAWGLWPAREREM